MIELGGKFKCRAFFTRMFLLYHIQRKTPIIKLSLNLKLFFTRMFTRSYYIIY